MLDSKNIYEKIDSVAAGTGPGKMCVVTIKSHDTSAKLGTYNKKQYLA